MSGYPAPFVDKLVCALQLLIPGYRPSEGDQINDIIDVAKAYFGVAHSIVCGEVETWIDLIIDNKSMT